MGRTRLAIIVCAFAVITVKAFAQTPVSPEGWVVLPVEEYRALRDRANPPPSPPATPPVDATLTRVDYDLRLGSEAVVGRALLTIDVLRDGWVRVQLPGGFMVREARIGNQPVSIVEGPPPHVLLSRAGRFVIALDIVMPLTASSGTESIALPPSPAPISAATLTLPRAGLDVAATGGFIAEHVESANETRWTAYGQPNTALALRWKRRVDERRADQPLRFRARVTTMVGLGEEVAQLVAAVSVEVLQGATREIEVALPADLIVNHITGSNVADWDASAGRVRVRLLEPTETEASFVVQAEVRTARDGSIAVPIVRVPAAERETGGIAVDVVGAGEIGARQARGLDPADPSELGGVVAGRESPSMIAYRLKPLAAADRALTVTVVRYLPQAVLIANVEEARYRALAAEDGRLLVEARYAVRNNQRSFLKITLPPDSVVWSATVSGRPVRPGLAGTDAVLLPLEKGKPGQDAPTFVVQIVYLQAIDRWLEKGHARVELPALDLPVSRTGFELHHSPRFRLDLQPGGFRVATDPGPFAEALRSAAGESMASRGTARLTAKGLQELVDQYRAEAGATSGSGALPVHVAFPAVGPSIFLASELTAETTAPALVFAFNRTK